MKKNLISLAVGAALASGTAMTQAADVDVDVYGKMHLSYGIVGDEYTGTAGNATDELNDNWQLRSHASRLGVKASAKISETLSGVAKIEYEVNPDGDTVSGDNTAGLKRRNQYAGLKGNFGEVRFGRHDTPLKLAQGKFDEFNDTDADIKGVLGISRGEERFDNVLAYLSPNFGGFNFQVAFAPGEGDGTTTGDGPADTISLAAQFKMGGLHVTAAHNMYDDTSTANVANGSGDEYKDLSRIMASFGGKMWQVAGIYETSGKGANVATGTDKDAFGVSGHVTFAGKHKIKAQYMLGEEKDATREDNAGNSEQVGDAKQGQMSLGYDFKMSKQTTAYAMFTAAVDDMGNHTVADEYVYAFYGVGLIQKF